MRTTKTSIARKYKSGDPTVAILDVLNAYSNLFESSAAYFSQRYPIDYDDLYQEAIIGFMKYLEGYEPTISPNFNSYISTRLAYYMSNQCKNSSSGVGVNNETIEKHYGKGASLYILYPCGLEVNLGQDDPFEEDVHTRVDISAYQIQQLMQTLTERERQIIMYRFGFFDGEEWTLKRIAEECHLTQERIRQIEKKCIRKLQRELYRQKMFSCF